MWVGFCPHQQVTPPTSYLQNATSLRRPSELESSSSAVALQEHQSLELSFTIFLPLYAKEQEKKTWSWAPEQHLSRVNKGWNHFPQPIFLLLLLGEWRFAGLSFLWAGEESKAELLVALSPEGLLRKKKAWSRRREEKENVSLQRGTGTNRGQCRTAHCSRHETALVLLRKGHPGYQRGFGRSSQELSMGKEVRRMFHLLMHICALVIRDTTSGALFPNLLALFGWT